MKKDLSIGLVVNVPKAKFSSKNKNHLSKDLVQHIPPMYAENEEVHFEGLIKLLNKHDNDSVLVFFNTIAECEKFHNYLYLKHSAKNELSKRLQILDDTHDPKNKDLKPSEETVIQRAKDKKMITITTAAGSRGLDFEDIDVGISAKPGLYRVNIQKAGRIKRKGGFGTF